MDGMTVSKLQVDVAKNSAKASEVARFLDQTPRKGLHNFLLRNLWAIAHAAAHVLFRSLTRMSQEMAKHPVDEDMPLFDTPNDHAMTVREIEDWIDEFKAVIIGDYQRDDTGRGEFQQPEPEGPRGGLAGKIKRTIADAGDTGMTWEEIGMVYEGASHELFGASIVEMLLWAMVHTGELSEGEDDRLIAADAVLSLDIVAMTEAQRELGTEEGLPDTVVKAIPLVTEGDAPDLVDVVSVKIFAGGGATESELFEDLQDAAGVSAALAWLVEQQKIEVVMPEVEGEGDDGDAEGVYMPFGQNLDEVHGDTLRAIYELETGEKSGRKGEDRMRKEITAAREKKAETADPEPEEGEADEGADETEGEKAAGDTPPED